MKINQICQQAKNDPGVTSTGKSMAWNDQLTNKQYVQYVHHPVSGLVGIMIQN